MLIWSSSSTTSTRTSFLFFLLVQVGYHYSISKMLVKKSTDLKPNLPLSRHLSLLWRSFSCGIGQLIFVASPLFFISFVTGVRARFLSDERSTRSTRWVLFVLLSFVLLSSLSSSSSDGDRVRFFTDERSTRSTRSTRWTRFGAFLGIVFSESWWK